MSEKTLLYTLSTLARACAFLVAFVGTLVLLIPAIPAHADLSEADGMIGISAREVGWVVRFPREGYRLLIERERPGALLPAQPQRDELERLCPHRTRRDVHHRRGMPRRLLAEPKPSVGYRRASGPLGAQRVRVARIQDEAPGGRTDG